jgi:hypothetical protein
MDFEVTMRFGVSERIAGNEQLASDQPKRCPHGVPVSDAYQIRSFPLNHACPHQCPNQFIRCDSLPTLVPDRPPLSLTGLLPVGFIAAFEDMPREIHFPKLLVVIDGEPSNTINPHRNVPPPCEFPIYPLTLDEDHGHDGAVQSKVK